MLTVATLRTTGGTVFLPEPRSLQIDASYEIPADSLSVSVPMPPDSSLVSFSNIRVVLDGGLLFDGLVDDQQLVRSGAGTILTIRARSRASLLLDNEALPQVFTAPRLTDIYKACVEQYGFSGLLYDQNPRLFSYPVAKGRSEWQALELFCRQTLGRRPYMQGNYISTRPRAPARTLELGASVGRPFTSLTIRENRYCVTSKVVMKHPISKLYSFSVLNPQASDWQIRRKRYVVPPNEWDGALRKGADRIIRDSMAKYWTLSVTMPGLIQASVGDRARVHDPAAPSNALAVYECSHQIGEFGSRTVLLLAPPDYLD